MGWIVQQVRLERWRRTPLRLPKPRRITPEIVLMSNVGNTKQFRLMQRTTADQRSRQRHHYRAKPGRPHSSGGQSFTDATELRGHASYRAVSTHPIHKDEM
jgi:hypothetical protein